MSIDKDFYSRCNSLAENIIQNGKLPTDTKPVKYNLVYCNNFFLDSEPVHRHALRAYYNTQNSGFGLVRHSMIYRKS